MSGILAALAGIKTAIATAVDEYFNRVTLLLNTSSTNGAQNNTFLDSSTNNFTITRNGNTTQGTFTPFSQTGWGVANTIGQYCQLNNSDYAISTGDFTVEFWMFCTDDTSYSASTFATPPSNPGFTVAMTNGSSNARLPYLEYGGGGTLFSAFSDYLNKWTHVAFVRSSGNVTVYQNGVATGAAVSKSAAVGSTANLYLLRNSGDTSADFRGSISNFRICKSAVYTSNFTPSTSPFTTTSQGATNCVLLTFQDNRFKDNSTTAATVTPTSTAIQAFSPFLPTAAYDTAVVGGSGYFDGTGDWLTAPNNTAFDFGSGNFTIEAWYYPTVTSPNSGIFGKRANGAVYGPFVVEFASSLAPIFYFSTTGSSWNQITSSVSCLANSWNHIAVTRSGSTFTIWVNGVSGGTASTASALMTNTDAVSIGAVAADGTRSITGYLSGGRLIKGTAQYTATFTPPTAPPTAITNTQLLLNYTNSGIYDSASKNVLETVGNAQVSTTQAKWGTTAIYLDGNGDYLFLNAATANNLLTFGAGDFTVEGWFYFSNVSGDPCLCSGYVDSSNGWYLQYYAGSIEFALGGSAIISRSVTLSNSTWYHIAVSRSSGSLRVFLNGTQQGATITSNTSNFNVTNGFYVGILNSSFAPTTRTFAGYIDDLRVTKGYARYTANFTAPTEAFPLQ